MDDELSSFKKELLERQEELFKIHERISKNQIDISRVLKKHSRLRQHKKFLDERNMKMLGHDLEILEDLDKQNPPPPSPPKGMDFSSPEGVGSNELLNPISPGFWVQLNAIVDDNSKAISGNLSNSQ
jgi:hypothetical protein